ncbi:Uncharacterised protein [Mycobacteroides abscessus]|nr:Uncharacterised protein [Mycobacteroides abscessus]
MLVGVAQLQQLHGPLHVGQPAAPQLGVGVRVRTPWQPLGIDPRLDPADLAHRVLGDTAGRIPRLVDHVQEAQPQIRVSGDAVRAQQRLHLPRLRPLRVVGLVGGQGAHHRPVASLGPQPRVDLQRRVGARSAEQLAHLLGNGRRPPDRFGIGGLSPRLAHIEDIRVGPVAQLTAAQPAHTDNGDDGRRLFALRNARLDHRVQGGLQDCHPYRGECATYLHHIQQAQQVRRGHSCQLPAP